MTESGGPDQLQEEQTKLQEEPPGPEQEPGLSGQSDLPDADLARACQNGDTAAFAQLVERYQRLVFKIAWQKTHNRADAEDVTQDVFMHVYRSLPRLRDPQAFLGWLIAISHRRATRFFRSRQSKLATHEEAWRQREREESTRSREEPGGSQVVELVRSLPEEYRVALTMKYLEGCSYEEIGTRLSISFHQVDYLLRKAKRALREASSREQSGWERSGRPSDPRSGGTES